MAKKLENMNKKEVLVLAAERGIDLPPRAKKREILALLKKPKIEQVTEPELSEMPVIEGEQATALVPETDESKPDLPSPTEPTVSVTCSGCKSVVDSATVIPCLVCPRSLVYCPACAKPGTCHKCGKKLK